MRKGSLNTVSKDLALGGKTLSPSPGMKEMGGLMSGDAAGVDVKQIEGLSLGLPKLKTPSKDLVKGSKTPASAGAKIGKANLKSPSVNLRKGY